MTVDPYIDAETGVLRNRLGIVEPATLRQAEADLSQAAIADLGTRNLPGRYDLDHLCAFHREIFGDLYPWAGEIRVVGIAKSDPFCLPQHIAGFASEVFAALAADRYLRGFDRCDFLTKLTHYFAEVNAIHPFREGNGRAQRAYFLQLAREAGWLIDWSILDPEENIQVSMASLRGDNGPLREQFEALVKSSSRVR